LCSTSASRRRIPECPNKSCGAASDKIAQARTISGFGAFSPSGRFLSGDFHHDFENRDRGRHGRRCWDFVGVNQTDGGKTHLRRGEPPVGTVMIKCPNTGHPISTGIEADRDRFLRMPVFFGRSHCAICGTVHEWFAQDAWVDERAAAVRPQLAAKDGQS
jgi:hypothetical protein